MNECEVKILEVDVADVKRKLAKLGAKKVFDGVVNFIHYDFPDKRLRKNNQLLRVRTRGAITELTFKTRSSNKRIKEANELEVKVSDFKTMRNILVGIGLVEKTNLQKHRTSFSIKDAHFELDTLPGLPTFLEIEAESEKRVLELVKSLGYSEKDAKPWSREELLRHYKK